VLEVGDIGLIEKPNPDGPVYKIEEVDGTRKRILPRNLLLPIGSISNEISEVVPVVERARPIPKLRTRLQKPKLVSMDESFLNDRDHFHSDSDGDSTSTNFVAHLEQPHVVVGVQANDPPKNPPVEYIPKIRNLLWNMLYTRH